LPFQKITLNVETENRDLNAYDDDDIENLLEDSLISEEEEVGGETVNDGTNLSNN